MGLIRLCGLCTVFKGFMWPLRLVPNSCDEAIFPRKPWRRAAIGGGKGSNGCVLGSCYVCNLGLRIADSLRPVILLILTEKKQ